MPKGTKLQRQATTLAERAGINYTAALRTLEVLSAEDADKLVAATTKTATQPEHEPTPVPALTPKPSGKPRKLPTSIQLVPGTQADLRLIDSAKQGVFPLGPTKNGTQAEVRLADGHLLVVGDHDTGKQNLLNLLLRGAGHLPDEYDVVVCDCGEWPTFDRAAATAANITVADHTRQVSDEVHRIRQEVMKRRSKKITGKRILLVVDPLGEVVFGRFPASVIRDLADIMTFGPTVGVHVAATMSWLPSFSNLDGLLPLFTNRVLLGWAREESDETLFGKQVDAEDREGRGWLKAGNADPVQFQTYLVDVHPRRQFEEVAYLEQPGLIEFQLGRTVKKGDRNRIEHELTQLYPGTVLDSFDAERHKATLRVTSGDGRM